jgi:hypothetical protein|tara:strand:- start:15 stop:869 length:855 start_codon:yes stop_codon:yes gene_type:complete
MRKLLLILLCLPFIGFGQTSEDAMQKLRNVKELLELNLITQIEYDSISVELKNIIINSNSEVKKNSSNIDDGFYYNGNIIYPEKFSESKTDYLGTALTYGLAGGGTKSYLNNQSSKTKIDIDNQEFILQITKNVDLAGNTQSNIALQQFFSTVQSPQDFALIRFKIKKTTEQRWIKTGSVNLLEGYTFAINSKEYLDFDWERLPELRGFKIQTELTSGEYAFVFIGTSAYSQNAIYTFSIEEESIKEEVITKDEKENSTKPKRRDYKSSSDYMKALRKYHKSIE